MEYVESTVGDVAVANTLMTTVMADSIDDLAPQARKLYRAIRELVASVSEEMGIPVADVRLTRKRIREATNLRNTQLGDRLRRLTEHEYLFAEKGLHGRKYYRLATDGRDERQKMEFSTPR